MNKHYQDLAIVIPSLDPSPILIPYIKSLISHGFTHIYVVNDGSDYTYDPIFQNILSINECTVLTHSCNQGKGAALKTAYESISLHSTSYRGVITADSDGQHAVEDVCLIADSLLQGIDGLLLGGRNFSQPDVPIKSWVGNRISSLTFFLLNGTWVQDTQTGLRGFSIKFLPEMLAISGDRFEYETAVLTNCVNKKIPIHTIMIHTIYIDGNTSSHFRPLIDSLMIGRVLLNRICRYMLSSGIACLIDVTLCCGLLSLLRHFISFDLLRIGMAVVLARFISMIVNYMINKNYVFKMASYKEHSFIRYFLLAVANMMAATILIYLGKNALLIDERVAKILTDTILFIFNYQIQRKWVFSTNTSQ